MTAIYVAGGSTERLSVVRPMLERLRAAGHKITHDWTTCEGYAAPMTPALARKWAREDLDGVAAAELVWVMVPEVMSEGAGVELGYALAHRARGAIVSGPGAGRCIFHALAVATFSTHEAAFVWIGEATPW